MAKKIMFTMLCIIQLMVYSCASGPKFDDTADFCGIVVNQNGEAVSGYRVSLATSHGKEFFTFTDKNGMFVFHEIPSGTVTLSGSGEGWGKFFFKKQFTNRSDLTYVQVFDSKILFEQSVNQMIAGNFAEAENTLIEITESNSQAEYVLLHYLKTLIYHNKNEIKSANKEIAAIEKIGASEKAAALRKIIGEKK